MSKQWIPVADGRYEWENSVGDRDIYLKISEGGQRLEQWDDDYDDREEIAFGSSGANYRLCQLLPVAPSGLPAPVAVVPVPDEVLRGLRMALDLLRNDLAFGDITLSPDGEMIRSAAEAWLVEQEGR